ncbi:MAG: 3-hydroxyacyl-ACP dehydratase [Bacteroidetes bacterium OLB11]|nr:MAG: 3-hydroxyacyl-ACP dehydratase [Bacteroidetes bacterium OLB11]
MLLNNLYTIVENQKNENKIFSQIEINPHHEIFKGHFPTQPILPGVCMIEIAKEILQENFNQKLFLSQSSAAKFFKYVFAKSKHFSYF